MISTRLKRDLILLFLMFFATTAFARQELSEDARIAVAQIRENADTVLRILREDNGENGEQVRKRAEDYAKPYFDFKRMTILAVGRSWRKARPEQKRLLTERFENMLINMYSGTMLQFKNTRVTVKDRPVVGKNGKEIVVRSELVPSDGPFTGKVFNVDYKLYKSEKGFRIYDVVVNGISLVLPYRTEFSATIERSGIEGLIAKLENGKVSTPDPVATAANKTASNRKVAKIED